MIDELQQQFKDSNSKVAFCMDSNFKQVLNAVKNVPKVLVIFFYLDCVGFF